MKRFLYLLCFATITLICGCSKSSPNPTDNSTNTTTGTGTNTGTGSGTGTNPAPNPYVVKTIGISRIVVGVDKNFKITVAQLYGGGNKVILQSGTGNTLATAGTGSYGVIPDAVGNPDGTLGYINATIDNGNSAIDTSGNSAAVIKIKGFDKAKTGYNQLNLVMFNFVWPVDYGSAGYHTNLTYLTFTKTAGTHNTDYTGAFLATLFSGNINVADVEIAAPQSAHPYLTDDEIVSEGQAVVDGKTNLSLRADLASLFYRVLFTTTSNGISVGSNLKWEWVNATNGTVTKFDAFTYIAKFNNIKTGGLDQVVMPSDSTSKVFLRISGLDPAVCGFNQVRLFIANDGFYDGSLQVLFNTPQTATLSLTTIENAYKGTGLYCDQIRPEWPHY